MRESVVAQLRAHPERYAAYVPGDFQEYCNEMAEAATWGDHITLQVSYEVVLLLLINNNAVRAACTVIPGLLGAWTVSFG